MPRRFFRKFVVKRPHGRDQWYFAPFKRWLKDGRLWSIRRRAVVPALALGLFIAFLPFTRAYADRDLFPPDCSGCQCTNRRDRHVGRQSPDHWTHLLRQLTDSVRGLLELEERPFDFELSWQWLSEKLGAIWQPFLLGSAVMGAGVALLSYLTLNMLWRYSIADYKARKLRERHGVTTRLRLPVFRLQVREHDPFVRQSNDRVSR